MRVRLILRVVIAVFAASISVTEAAAQSLFDRLVMPGDLIEGHAKYQKQCSNCHEAHGSVFPGLSEQETTCFACHNAVTPNTNPDLPFDATELEYAFTAMPNDNDPTDVDGLIRIYHHPIGDAEQDGGNRRVECASCHNAHLVDQDYSPTTSKISDPTDVRLDWQITWVDGTLRGNISALWR